MEAGALELNTRGEIPGLDRSAPNASVDILHCCLCKNRLQRPLLLSCLHSCCERCAAAHCDGSSSGSSIVVCPLCKEATDVSTKRFNAYVESRLQFCQKDDRHAACEFCVESEDNTDRPKAEIWCQECRKFLCYDCSRQHKKFNKDHKELSIAEMCEKSKLPDAPPCLLHLTKTQDFVCCTCQELHCPDCIKACIAVAHDVQDPLNGDYTLSVIERINNLKRELEAKSPMFENYERLASDLGAARRSMLDTLQENKRHLLKAIETAFIKVEMRLYSTFDDLGDKAQELLPASLELKDTVSHALEYTSGILQNKGVKTLLQQHKPLLSRLERLACDVRKMYIPVAAAQVVTFESIMPANVDAMMTTWLGQPVLQANIDCGESWKDAARRSIFNRSTDGSDLGSVCSRGEAGVPLQVGPITNSFCSPVDCHDLAFSATANSLLLATGSSGLKEFNFNGEEMGCWMPPESATHGKPVRVIGVDLTMDGCAVSLDPAACVLLTMATGAWTERRRIEELHTPFYSLSVNGNFVAAALGWRGRHDHDASVFVVVSLYGKGIQSTSKVDQLIDQLIAIRESVIVSCRDKEREKFGRRGCLLLGYTYDGSCLWMISPSYTVLDMWADHISYVTYLLVLGDDFRIVVLDGQCSQQLKELTLSQQVHSALPRKMSARIVGRLSQLKFAFCSSNNRRLFVCDSKLPAIQLPQF